MKVIALLICAAASTGLSGCSGFYEGFKGLSLDECYHLPYPDQEECLREVDVSYEEYEKNRKQVIKKE